MDQRRRGRLEPDIEPLAAGAAIDAMLRGDVHQVLNGEGVAHFAGPVPIEVDADGATALTYAW